MAETGMIMSPSILLTTVGLSVGIICALIGVVYSSLSKQLEKKVDKDLYVQAMQSIEKALDSINGTALTLKNVVQDVSNIQDKFLTKQEHEYICAIEKTKSRKDNV
jgi:hypothetical protein